MGMCLLAFVPTVAPRFGLSYTFALAVTVTIGTGGAEVFFVEVGGLVVI